MRGMYGRGFGSGPIRRPMVRPFRLRPMRPLYPRPMWRPMRGWALGLLLLVPMIVFLGLLFLGMLLRIAF